NDGSFQIEVLVGRDVTARPGEDRLTRVFEVEPGEWESLERREISTTRTAILVGLGAVLASVAIERAVTGGSDDPGNGSGTGFSLILGRFPILFGN
ncbi:MAG: hypothetical protein R3324_06910, partial [Halobacteriales archaeon]|nr:hypothetical protein [Halobacteriales archaeon]